MKELSSQTSNLVSSVESSLKNVQTSSQSVMSNMNQAMDQSKNNSVILNEFSLNIAESEGEMKTISQNNGKNSDRIFITLAKLDYVIWKVDTYISVVKMEPTFTYTSHSSGRLGNWYYEGAGKQYFSNFPSYRHLENPLEKVHAATKTVFENIPSNNATKILEGIETMEQSSERVFECLDNIVREKEGAKDTMKSAS